MTSTADIALEADDSLVTLSEAAEQLDVHYMTAYRYVRTGRMVATKKSGKWWVTPSDLAAVIAEGTGARRRPAHSGAPRQFHVEPFVARLTNGDTAGCWDLVSAALSSGATPAQVYSDLVCVALRDIGEQWNQGNLSVADEHRATSTVHRLIGQMGPLFRHRGRRRGTIILGSVVGDNHGMPTALMADLLSDRRFEVVDLGANTPTESLIESAAGIDDLLGFGLCVAVDSQIDAAIRQVSDLRQALPESFVLIGGPALLASGRHAEFLPHVNTVTVSSSDVCQAFEQRVTDRSAN